MTPLRVKLRGAREFPIGGIVSHGEVSPRDRYQTVPVTTAVRFRDRRYSPDVWLSQTITFYVVKEGAGFLCPLNAIAETANLPLKNSFIIYIYLYVHLTSWSLYHHDCCQSLGG